MWRTLILSPSGEMPRKGEPHPYRGRRLPWARTPRDLADRFWEKVEKGAGCWLWKGGLAPNGYGRFKISIAPLVHRSECAHRVAWLLARGSPPPGLHVAHRCDQKRCVRPDHLELLTPRQNSRDAASRNLKPFGTRVRSAKLTRSQVARLRTLRARGWSLNQLSAEFGVTPGHIGKIVRNKIRLKG